MRRRIPALVATVAILAVVTLVGLRVFGRKASLRPSMRTVLPQDVANSPALQDAYRKYKQRGGNYIWGTNDCSVFVSDYLLKRSPKFKWRLTTASLDSIYVNKYNLYDAGPPKSGDIINYRYRSQRTSQAAGHCGVVVKADKDTFVIHNCASRGLVIQPHRDFVQTAVALGVDRLNIRTLRLK